jgi:hypothetical protein
VNGDDHAQPQNESVQPPDAQALPLSSAAPDVVSEFIARQPASHILAELDRILADTPQHAHLTPPLRRSLVVAAAREIRRLCALWVEGNL